MVRKAAGTMAKSEDKVTALAEFLTEQGYAASVGPRGTGEELCQHHCPIAHVAAEFPSYVKPRQRRFQICSVLTYNV